MTDNKRMHWFDRQFLRAKDFTDEQDYHLERRRRHNRLLHTPGIVVGLDVSVSSTDNKNVIVKPGMAIDEQGREIVLLADEPQPVPGSGTTTDLYIVYAESQTDKSQDPGVTGFTRWTESPGFVFSPPHSPPTSGLRLARIPLSGGTVNGNLDFTVRDKGAGAVVDNDIEVFSLALKLRGSTDKTQWPKLSCTAANQATLEHTTDLRISEDMATIIFRNNGFVMSSDNGHSLVFNRTQSLLELREISGSIVFRTGGLAERMRIDNNGQIGIGTATPLGILDIRRATDVHLFVGGKVDPNQPANTLSLNAVNDANSTGVPLEIRSSQTTFTRGSVGIGTTQPQGTLDLSGGNSPTDALFVQASSATANQGGIVHHQGAQFAWQEVAQATDKQDDGLLKFNFIQRASPGTQVKPNILVLKSNGNVGIGTDAPATPLEVVGRIISQPDAAKTFGGAISLIAPDAAGWFHIDNKGRGQLRVSHGGVPGQFQELFRIEQSGNVVMAFTKNDNGKFGTVGIGTDQPDGNSRLHVVGDVLIHGNLKVEGSINTDTADEKKGYVVDQFVNNLGDPLEQGDVVIVSASQESLALGLNEKIPLPEVDLTDKPYDTRVCGVVVSVHGVAESRAEGGGKSGKAKRGGKGRAKGEAVSYRPLSSEERASMDTDTVAPGQVGGMATLGALAYCKVDADIAPIKAGDLLTTSKTKGHAQKVEDPAKAVGAIIGKALGSLKKGRGKIPIIVLMQ